ncbi:hypothetical protein THAOC_21788, partial [Thalassiosira oceanica]
MRLGRQLMKDRSDPDYERHARKVKQFEDEYGEDWDGTMIEYDSDLVDLPWYVIEAVLKCDFQTVLQWLKKGKIKERANAKSEDSGTQGFYILQL